MQAAPLPDDEPARLEALQQYFVLDTTDEPEFDELTRFASELCGTPIALISLVDAKRQWFKSRVGLSATETPRDLAFCAHAILQKAPIFEVPHSAADERFADNPLVTGDPHVNFYAGTPLVTPAGHAIGTLCVIDRIPRTLSPLQRHGLAVLGHQVVTQLELRRRVAELAASGQRQEQLIRQLASPIIALGSDTLLVPIVSALDPTRSAHLSETLLRAIATRRARTVIIDLTGLDTLDGAAAEQLLRLSSATSLVGAEMIVAGIGPKVALALIGIDSALQRLKTVADASQALALARATSPSPSRV